MSARYPSHLIGICAFSGTGKTTLLKKLVPLLKAEGLRLAVVKHAHHSFDIDYPGKDSYEVRRAGADCAVVVSRDRLALVEEISEDRPEPRLAEALAAIDTSRFDLILAEGFKHEDHPKIELHRPSLGRPLLHPTDPTIVAVATDAPVELARSIPRLDLNDVEAIRDFVLSQSGATSSGATRMGVR